MNERGNKRETGKDIIEDDPEVVFTERIDKSVVEMIVIMSDRMGKNE